MLLAIPEHKTSLPGGGRPSQSDVFVLGKSGPTLVSITVEGKVSEPFGPTVAEWRETYTPGREARLLFLCNQLDLEPREVGGIRYQLLHRTVSALVEAAKFNASHALMMVHSFSQTHEWFDDYVRFAGLFKVEAAFGTVQEVCQLSGIKLYLSWVCGETKYLSVQ